MGELIEIARSRLDGVPAYQPGQPSPDPHSGKLSSNESPLSPAPGVQRAVALAMGSAHHYPDQQRARGLVAAYSGVDPARVILTNGSDELCYLLAQVFLGSGRVAVLGEPCYQIDATASLLAGARLHPVPLCDGGHDLEAMAKAAAQDAAVVWLPSPHNPTGVAADPGDLAEFLARVPADCLVVLDQAYQAFTDPERQPDVLGLLAAHPNLVVQRTMSKDWALAGLRMGYGIASPELVEFLGRVRPPFSVNSLALAALEASLEATAWRTMIVARVREQRSALEQELTRLSIEHFPSQANFVTARLDARRLTAALAGSGLVVRSGEDLGLPGWVRISVGWAPTMARLRGVLKTISGARCERFSDHQARATRR